MKEHERTSQLEALAFHLQEVSESEKTRLARDLHDALGSLLTAIKMDMAWVRGRLNADQGVLIEKLERAMKNLDQAIQKKRQIIEGLRPTTLSTFGLVTAARELAEEEASRAGWKLRLDMPEEEPTLRVPLQVVRGVRGEHRRPGERNRDARAELDAFGVLGGDHEREERVAPRLRGDQPVVAERFQFLGPMGDVVEPGRHDPRVHLHGVGP